MAAKNNKTNGKRGYRWANWSTKRLLPMRICDLGLEIKGTELEERIAELYAELAERDFVFRPHFWLSDEWFCPDGVPGVAIPFFLAHPRLKRLEEEHIYEVEGGNAASCMRLLRHETGHALLNAYQLHRRSSWRLHFGKSSIQYPDTYLPRPYSRRFVIHLENWYAQSHPHEDWAETFAVWLTPQYDWRRRYKDWPALKKLEYVDQLMQEIKTQRPRLRTRRNENAANTIRMTLREYYLDKQSRYGTDGVGFYDRDLRKLFSDKEEHKRNEKASAYIRRVRMDVINVVARWTNEYNYRINEVLKEMIDRCDKLDLHVAAEEESMKVQTVTCVTTLVMHQLHSGGFHVAL